MIAANFAGDDDDPITRCRVDFPKGVVSIVLSKVFMCKLFLYFSLVKLGVSSDEQRVKPDDKVGIYRRS